LVKTRNVNGPRKRETRREYEFIISLQKRRGKLLPKMHGLRRARKVGVNVSPKE